MPFLPWFPQRDYAWGIRDHLWEWDIVERLRNGGAGPQSISVHDACPSQYNSGLGGWEYAEEHSKNANRLHSAYLTDEAIAKRAVKRDLLRQQAEERAAAWKAYEEGKGPRPEDTASDVDPFAAQRRATKARHEAEAKRKNAERNAAIYARRAIWEDEAAVRREEKRVRDEQRNKEAAEVHRQLDRMRAVTVVPPERLKYLEEEKRIMDSNWVCTICGGKSFIERLDSGYQITCLDCVKTAFGSHQALWGVLSK